MSGPRAGQIGRDEATYVSEGLPRVFGGLDGIRYSLSLPDLGITLDVDRLRWQRGELIAELTVHCDLAGARRFDGDVIASGELFLTRSRERQERARLLAERSAAGDVDWVGLLEELAWRVNTAERDGSPAVRLAECPKPSPDHDHRVLHGLTLSREHPSILFGAPGVGKSILALAAAVELAHDDTPVLYVDYELSEAAHRERLEQLCGPQNMPRNLFYVRATRPLVAEADRLRRIIAEEQIRFSVIDSILFACAGPPETAEAAGGFFAALRTLGTGNLSLSHVTKAAEGADRAPFGSQLWFAGARNVWFVQAAESPDPNLIPIGLFHRKANLGSLRPAVGLEIRFTNERIGIQQADITKMPELAQKLSLHQRITGILKRGAMTDEQVMLALADQKPDSVARIIRRAVERGTLIRLPGANGEPTLGLAERRSTEHERASMAGVS